MLETYTNHPPPSEDHWYQPWHYILTTLFSLTQLYTVNSQWSIWDDSSHERQVPDFIVEKCLPGANPNNPPPFRPVLIVEIKNYGYGVRALMWDDDAANWAAGRLCFFTTGLRSPDNVLDWNSWATLGLQEKG